MSLRVAIADTPDAREQVYRFRYRILVDELGLRPAEADQAGRRLTDEFDDRSVAYAVLDGDAVIGSLRLIYLADLPDATRLVSRFAMQPAIEAFGAQAICTTSRFILAPALRQGAILLQLMERAFEDARSRGVRLNYSDCSPHMLPFYESLGYRRYAAPFNDTSYGYKVPLLMMLGEHEWFARVRSPLRRIVRRHPDDPQARAWFERTYPGQRGMQSAQFMPEGVFLDTLAGRVARDPLHHLSVLRGLGREEADVFLRQATVIKARPGDRIVREGERDDTLFVLLSGLAEVTLGKTDSPVALLGAGDTFGEMSFLTGDPRSANVEAKVESEVLVLSGKLLQRLIEENPKVAAKVLLNLSRILAGRLMTTTRNRRAVKGG